MTEYNVLKYGAIGDGKTNNAKAIQEAIDDCNKQGGGRILLPSGNVFCTGVIELKTNCELYIETGCTLLGSSDIEDYGTKQNRNLSLIKSKDADNVSITGGGKIDGNSSFFIEEKKPYIYKAKKQRPYVVRLTGGEKITISNLSIVNGPVWTVTLEGCTDVSIYSLTIKNDMRMPNSDGIDLDRCRNVRISNCHIEAGDDCIVLKTHKRTAGYGSCENVTITGCTMISRSFAINIGCEVKAPIRNVVVSDCVIYSSHRGVGVHLSEESDVENVLFSNLIIETQYYHPDWWGAAEPIYISVIPWTDKDTVGVVRNIRFTNILCKSENGIFVYSSDKKNVNDIVFDKVSILLDKWTSESGGRHDIRPCPGEMNGLSTGVYQYPSSGFYINKATNVTIRNCDVKWGENVPDYFKHAIESHNVDGLLLENFKGKAARPDSDDDQLID